MTDASGVFRLKASYIFNFGICSKLQGYHLIALIFNSNNSYSENVYKSNKKLNYCLYNNIQHIILYT